MSKYGEFKYNKCIGSIIRMMSSLNISSVFKYNKCIGSIFEVFLSIFATAYLNTTNVSVQ